MVWGATGGWVWATVSSKVERKCRFCFDNGAIVRFHYCVSAITLLRQRTNQHFFRGPKAHVRIQPETERTLALASWFKGTSMGEIFLLLSCGAAFVTGLEPISKLLGGVDRL
jgi:hypothetical protein